MLKQAANNHTGKHRAHSGVRHILHGGKIRRHDTTFTLTAYDDI